MHDLGSISARTQKNDAWRLACGTGHYFYGITGVKTNVKTSRKLKSGVNEITASVRATYGTAHQVRMNSQYRILTVFHQVGMGSSKHQLQDKKKVAKEVVFVS